MKPTNSKSLLMALIEQKGDCHKNCYNCLLIHICKDYNSPKNYKRSAKHILQNIISKRKQLLIELLQVKGDCSIVERCELCPFMYCPSVYR